MNIYNIYLKKIKNTIQKNIKILNLKEINDFKNVTVENPPKHYDYDLSCNVALILSKLNKNDPKKLSEKLKDIFLNELKEIDSIDIAGPGFLNINLKNSGLLENINNILRENTKYGSEKNTGNFNIEFVSANPTGPMHVGHCRGAIFGDVLSNLLIFNGYKVTKEYYINDYGNQIKNFTKSVFLRIREIKYNEKFKSSEDLYPGEYIIEIAKKILKKNNNKYDKYEDCLDLLTNESLKYSMEMIRSDLSSLGISHDIFTSENDIVKNKFVIKAVDILKKQSHAEEGFLDPPKGEDSKNWKKIKRLIFKSKNFGDDNNRALQKNDGSWTYFANDLAYHLNKIERNYDKLINILGADHTGYIKRIEAGVRALSNNKTELNCKVCQLVKLFKSGKPFKMSKRSGDFISVDELLQEVNKDGIRFMMLNRSNDVELEFDFDKVLEKSKDNPVFYVQYCYARINSIYNTINLNLNESIKIDKKDFSLNKYERDLLRKIFEWPKIIKTSSEKYEPHRIPFYLYELSNLFHTYWSKGNEDDKFRFIVNNKIKSKSTLIIIKAVELVIQNGMNILGVSLPKKM